MTPQASPESVTHRSRRRLLYSAVAVFVVVVVICVIVGAAMYLFAGSTLPPHPRRFSGVLSGPDAGPDATTLISTLVVIYTFFAAAYGALAPSLIKKKSRTSLVALLFIFLAVLLDVGRVWNSTGDLYATTMRQLSAAKVYDATDEFTRYLIVNACVLLFALAVAFWPAKGWRIIWSWLKSSWRIAWSWLKSKRGATALPETAPAEAAKTGAAPGQDRIPQRLGPRPAD
jgi:hypothetical protein